MDIRELEVNDYYRGYLKLLEQLTHTPQYDFEYFQDIFNQVNESKNIKIIVGVLEGKVIGTITIIIEPKFIRGGKKVGHIEDVVVDKNYRKKGIGKILINKAINLAKDKDCYKVILNANEKNRRFYQNCGFSSKDIEFTKYFL